MPDITTCLHNGVGTEEAEQGSGECYDKRRDKEDREYRASASEMENYVCIPPTDFNTLLEAVKRWKDD